MLNKANIKIIVLFFVFFIFKAIKCEVLGLQIFRSTDLIKRAVAKVNIADHFLAEFITNDDIPKVKLWSGADGKNLEKIILPFVTEFCYPPSFLVI
jgi:hypothetical protein